MLGTIRLNSASTLMTLTSIRVSAPNMAVQPHNSKPEEQLKQGTRRLAQAAILAKKEKTTYFLNATLAASPPRLFLEYYNKFDREFFFQVICAEKRGLEQHLD